MSDYYHNLCSENLAQLNNHLDWLAGKKTTEGSATYLGDVKLADAIQFLKQTDLYKTGDYKDINPDNFAGVFEKVGLSLEKTINENGVLIGKLHLGKLPFFQRETAIIAGSSEILLHQEQIIPFGFLLTEEITKTGLSGLAS